MQVTMQLAVLVGWLCVVAWSSSLVRTLESGEKQVLVIILDGFRHDYLDLFGYIPTFRSLQKRGTRVQAVIPELPTECQPNFYSLFTGLVPLDHGVVTNSMFSVSVDSKLTGGASKVESDGGWWNPSEPLWISAKKQGKRVALFSWPLCELPQFSAYRVDRCEPYRRGENESSSPDEDGFGKVDVAESLTLRIRRSSEQFAQDLLRAVDELRDGVHLAAVYTDLVDLLGHVYGPDDPLLADAFRRELEPTIAQLLLSLDSVHSAFLRSNSLRLADKVNVVMVSDHGMASALPDSQTREGVEQDSQPRTVNLSQFWKNSEVSQTSHAGAYVSIYPSQQTINSVGGIDTFVARTLSLMTPEQRDAVSFFTRDQLIAEMRKWDASTVRLRSSTHAAVKDAVRARVAPLVAVAKPGWLITTRSAQLPRYGNRTARGYHGYHAASPEMWGQLVAFGPNFATNRLIEATDSEATFRTRDTYLLLAELAGVQPLPSNASEERVAFLFRDSNASSTGSAIAMESGTTIVLCSLAVLTAMVLVVLVVLCAPWCRQFQQMQLLISSIQQRSKRAFHTCCTLVHPNLQLPHAQSCLIMTDEFDLPPCGNDNSCCLTMECESQVDCAQKLPRLASSESKNGLAKEENEDAAFLGC